MENGRIQLLDGAAGHTWGSEEIDEVLFSNHNNGTYRIVYDKFLPVQTRAGSFHIPEPPYEHDLSFIRNYNGISTYNKQNGSVQEIGG